MKHNKRGSIFIYTIWVVTLLTIFAVTLGYTARSRIMLIRRLGTRDTLRMITESGMSYVIDIIQQYSGARSGTVFQNIIKGEEMADLPGRLKTGDSIAQLRYNYKQSLSGGEWYALVSDEQGRLNVNTADVSRIGFLLEKAAGLEKEKAREVANNIVDWRDEDNERPELDVVNNEDLYYKLEGFKYKPKNALFESADELRLAAGVTGDIYDAIKPYITVYGDGRVNINTAPRLVFGALGIDDATADKIILYREGERSAGEATSRVFRSPDTIVRQLRTVVALNAGEVAAITRLVKGNLLGVDTIVFRIDNTAVYHGDEEKATCIVSVLGQVLFWGETFDGI